MSYQFDWYWGTDGMYHISKTDTGTVMDCVVSISFLLPFLVKGVMYCVISIAEMYCIVYMYVGMELGHWCTVSYLGG